MPSNMLSITASTTSTGAASGVASFGEGLRRLAARRDRYALVIQSYSRIAALIPGSLERALRS